LYMNLFEHFTRVSSILCPEGGNYYLGRVLV
jgi:hypothetical protein